MQEASFQAGRRKRSKNLPQSGKKGRQYSDITATGADLLKAIYREKKAQVVGFGSQIEFWSGCEPDEVPEVLDAFTQFRAGTHELFPIPESQIQATNGALTQNPGYWFIFTIKRQWKHTIYTNYFNDNLASCEPVRDDELWPLGKRPSQYLRLLHWMKHLCCEDKTSGGFQRLVISVACLPIQRQKQTLFFIQRKAVIPSVSSFHKAMAAVRGVRSKR